MSESTIESRLAGRDGPQSELEKRVSGEAPKDDAPTSTAEDLVAIREAIKDGAEPKLFELPGYGKRLQVKYRVIDADEVDAIFEKIAEQVKAEQVDNPMSAGLTDTIIAACVGFYSERTVERDGEAVTETVPLQEKYGLEGGPVRWGDKRLWKLLRIAEEGETLRVRDAVCRVLGEDRMLVLEHAQDVSRWMERARRAVKADFSNASPETAA
jgi:hypothetical protein